MLAENVLGHFQGSVTKNQIYMKIAILCALFFGTTNYHSVEAEPITPVTISQSKTEPVVFSFVRGHKLGKGFSVQWSMAASDGVDRFEVQSTYEDPNDVYSNWYTVGTANNSRHSNIFRMTDNTVLPGIISYRVVAIMSTARGYIVSPIYTTVIK